MKNGKYCIAIMSIGGGVGQSVITSCNLSRLPLYTIGFDMNPFAFGAYECDEFEDIPPIYSDEYLSVLIDKCSYHSIDLIIPGLDNEALILAKEFELFMKKGIKVLSSSKELVTLTRDKEKMHQKLSSFADIFVENFYLSEVKKLYSSGKLTFPLIAKPRCGSSSNNVKVLLGEEDLTSISENHIIQEIALPKVGDPNREVYFTNLYKRKNVQVSEISIQIVADTHGEIFGRMMSYNKLKNGIPIEILPFHNDSIWTQIDLILPKLKELGLKGPLNIQGRLTNKGFKVFEMNSRFTGITGLRAIMGFNEVEECIKRWLRIGDKKILRINYDRFGLRQIKDKVITKDSSERIGNLSKNINFNVNNDRKAILITGANGYLGQALINHLVGENYKIIAMGRSIKTLRELFRDYSNVSYTSINDFYDGSLQLGQIDFLIHCAFARPHRSHEEIADSLRFTNLLFSFSVQNQIPAIVNISSQSVYGTKHVLNWTENDKPMPETSYAQAKYASELLIENIRIINKHENGTSIRLPAITGASNGVLENEFLMKIIMKVISNEEIKIYDGKQKIDLLDVRDAANAIVALLKIDYRKWKKVYNLSTGRTHTLDEVVRIISSIGKEWYGYNAKIIKVESNSEKSFGMDSKLFVSHTKWEHKYGLEDIIKSIFDYQINSNE